MNSDRQDAGIQRETRYHYSRENDAYYRIDAWTYAGDGSVNPKEWEQVPPEGVPPNHRADNLGREPDEW